METQYYSLKLSKGIPYTILGRPSNGFLKIGSFLIFNLHAFVQNKTQYWCGM